MTSGSGGLLHENKVSNVTGSYIKHFVQLAPPKTNECPVKRDYFNRKISSNHDFRGIC